MRLFDFSLLVGTDPYSPAEATWEMLVEYLDSADAGGLISSLAGVYYDYVTGNRETLDAARGDRRLLAGLTVDPRRPDAGEVDFKAAAKDFRAAVFFANLQGGIAQNWALSHPCLPELAEKAAQAGLVIVVHAGRGGEVPALVKTASQVEVPVVALGLAYGAISEVIAGAGTARNLMFGTGLFAGLENIETLVSRIGPERLVYASGEARFSHGPCLGLLRSARISEEARELIAIGNARRIFGGVP